MRLDILCLADAATVDTRGALNILGAFTTIELQRFPATVRVVAALRLVGTLQDVGQHSLDVRVVDHRGTPLTSVAPTTVHLTVSPDSPARVELPGVLVMPTTFPAPGEYAVEVVRSLNSVALFL